MVGEREKIKLLLSVLCPPKPVEDICVVVEVFYVCVFVSVWLWLFAFTSLLLITVLGRI